MSMNTTPVETKNVSVQIFTLLNSFLKYENKTYVAAEPLRPAPFYLHQLRFLKPDANLHKIQICLQFPVAAVNFGKVAPAGIAHFTEKEPRAHLCIVSGTVVRTFGDGELLAKVTERVSIISPLRTAHIPTSQTEARLPVAVSKSIAIKSSS